jgi:hypothetical protein
MIICSSFQFRNNVLINCMILPGKDLLFLAVKIKTKDICIRETWAKICSLVWRGDNWESVM